MPPEWLEQPAHISQHRHIDSEQKLGLGAHLFTRYLDQEIVKGPFWSSSQAATCY